MNRRSFLAASGLALAGLSSRARADIAPSPPPPLVAEGRSTVWSRSGAPQSATWTLHNAGTEPLQITIENVVCILGSMRLPLRVTGTRLDGRDVRQLDLAPGARASLEVLLDGFTDAAAREARWTVEIRLRVTSAGNLLFWRPVQATAEIRRIPLPG